MLCSLLQAHKGYCRGTMRAAGCRRERRGSGRTTLKVAPTLSPERPILNDERTTMHDAVKDARCRQRDIDFRRESPIRRRHTHDLNRFAFKPRHHLPKPYILHAQNTYIDTRRATSNRYINASVTHSSHESITATNRRPIKQTHRYQRGDQQQVHQRISHSLNP